MTETNLYKAYTDDALLSSNPMGLVIALYEGAIDSIHQAKQCLATGDIAGRAKPINKISNILVELMKSLDHKQGGDVSRNLARLYNYMQRRVLEAHSKQQPGPLDEVEKLLSDMLDAWKKASATYNPAAQFAAAAATASPVRQSQPANSAGDEELEEAAYAGAPYGNYMADYADLGARQAYSF